MSRKSIRRTIVLMIFLFLFVYVFNQSGYSVIEKVAITNSFPFQDGSMVYEKEYANHKTIIWKTDHGYYAKLLESKWAFFHHVSNIAMLQIMAPLKGNEGDIERTWSANLNSNEKYDTVFAIKSNNPNIQKIIISNDNIDKQILEETEEIKKNSTVFIALNLENGFAAAYSELDAKNTGGFIFRGVDKEGKVIIAGL